MKGITRREFVGQTGLMAGAMAAMDLSGPATPSASAKDSPKASGAQSKEELVKELTRALAETEKVLNDYPPTLRKVKGYLAALRVKTRPSCSSAWLAYQRDRLKRIRWLADKMDDGRRSRMRLRMRPYDIPWLIWGIGRGDALAAKSTNGVSENVQKVLNAPAVEIEFTDKFADFCYLCLSLDSEGCSAHPEFAGHGTTFPQAVQMSPELRKDSDTILTILGLQWTDTITGKRLLDLCASKAPDPSAFDRFPLGKPEWADYRAGIKRIAK